MILTLHWENNKKYIYQQDTAEIFFTPLTCFFVLLLSSMLLLYTCNLCFLFLSIVSIIFISLVHLFENCITIRPKHALYLL